jgi:hypothetical protein
VLVSQSTVSRLAVRMASAGLVDRARAGGGPAFRGDPADPRRRPPPPEARSVAIEIIRQNFAAAVSGADAEHVAAALQAVRDRLAVAPGGSRRADRIGAHCAAP